MANKSEHDAGDPAHSTGTAGPKADLKPGGPFWRQRKFILAGLAVLVAAALYGARGWYMADTRPSGPPQRTVSVELARAERKPIPVQFDGIGSVIPIATVALKSRIETAITDVHFADGAQVTEGQLLFTLDGRQIDAQIAQMQGTLAKDQAQLEGAERDARRFSELITKGATTQVNLDNARTQADVLRATIKADQAALENLRVQKSYTEIRAPISGRISATAQKVGNFVRPADTTPLATINQIMPIYVSLAVPQRLLPDVQGAMAAGTAQIVATIPGTSRKVDGKVALIENAIDTATGMVTLRATVANAQEDLWPGTLVNAALVVRTEDVVVVPSVAVQRSQTGDFVFVVRDGAAVVQQVRVNRTFQGQSVIDNGLAGGESVVVDGQLLLSSGTKVVPRTRNAGA